MEKKTQDTTCVRQLLRVVLSYYTSASQNSWHTRNGKRNSLPGPQLKCLPYLRKIRGQRAMENDTRLYQQVMPETLYNTSDVGRESSVMENNQYQDPPCRLPELREP